MKIGCPHCRQHYRVENNWLGKTVSCQSCNEKFTITIAHQIADESASEPEPPIPAVPRSVVIRPAPQPAPQPMIQPAPQPLTEYRYASAPLPPPKAIAPQALPRAAETPAAPLKYFKKPLVFYVFFIVSLLDMTAAVVLLIIGIILLFTMPPAAIPLLIGAGSTAITAILFFGMGQVVSAICETAFNTREIRQMLADRK